MNYEIIITPRAERQIRQLERAIRTRVIEAIDGLSAIPRPAGSIKLRGTDAYRVRVGDYRVVYTIEDEIRIVTVVKVGHRREIYRN